MLVVTESYIIGLVGQYLLPLIRITAFFMAAPIFGTRLVSARVRLLLGVSMTILIAPFLADLQAVSNLSMTTMLIVIQQMMVGIALGFVFQVVFQVFILAGQYIAMKMGLGFASMNDPANGVSVTVLSQFYMLTTTLLFLSVNGHLVLIQILIDSFSILPIGVIGLDAQSFYQIVNLGGWMFGSALTIALPVLTALLLVNIAFGVMSRSAPQMNIFAVGFPITLLFGLFIMWVGFPALLPSFNMLIDEAFNFAINLMQ
ncbi:flagellar biosynthetic protein FliR [Candidatus Endobugula sertula]|uniref:Flagellar biosynthetic protein FliR n=1 Tax=Candidatus Endobugula sertula TaxID=62101 RepID=A0A1D2QN66_9GAMM|nr:flagellar biosynthetic protein FliR [Candidatus Endobugula sertula]